MHVLQSPGELACGGRGRAVAGVPVSGAAEVRCFAALREAAERVLAALPTSLQQDEAVLVAGELLPAEGVPGNGSRSNGSGSGGNADEDALECWRLAVMWRASYKRCDSMLALAGSQQG